MLAEYDLKPHSDAVDSRRSAAPRRGHDQSSLSSSNRRTSSLSRCSKALPGRPISGERLVRPDGKIDIGFYGEVYVRGLTLEQVKVAIIKHLRKFLDDEAVGT